MSIEIKPEVVLRRWRLSGRSISGEAYGHPKFFNGEYITTSSIQAIDKDSEDTFIIETYNTYYILEPAPDTYMREQLNEIIPVKETISE